MLLLLVCGSGLWILGILGDDQGWWTDRPFFINFVSSLTAACFGIPFAMLVLRYLQSVQRIRAESLSDLRNALIAMSTSLDEVIGKSLADRLESGLREARELYDTAHGAEGAGTAREWQKVLGAIVRLWTVWHPDSESDANVRQLTDLWKGAHEGAKARIIQAGLPPLENANLAKVDQCLDRLWSALSSANPADRYSALERDFPTGRTSSSNIRSFLTRYENLVARFGDLRRAIDAALVASL
ncbi:hypothetical protein DFJ67_1803 [Asanoa ferruginea]|uniref:Uncharacterized protein n=1 Tax=Asanoa ferruginea TaxID=53367 RepID=A0A3D9ZQC0_9ACTN|nr:hypothetical protein [Asanoa ferruginea]REF95840.1 hypothetical protein DFJ67_1803 [Asanoa ferruginea]GIF53841.1 hypothetical protein Afe04nite_83800 [Asanoa ferruginea]